MARNCAFCTHSDRQKLEEALIKREKTQSDIAAILGIDQSRVSRHMREHINSQKPDSHRIDDLVKQITALQDRLAALEEGFKEHRRGAGHRRF